MLTPIWCRVLWRLIRIYTFAQACLLEYKKSKYGAHKSITNLAKVKTNECFVVCEGHDQRSVSVLLRHLSGNMKIIHSDICEQRRLKSACASTQFDQSLHCSHEQTSRKHAYIMLTPLKPHFYIVKLGLTEIYMYIIFLISSKNINWGYSLEPPRQNINCGTR